MALGAPQADPHCAGTLFGEIQAELRQLHRNRGFQLLVFDAVQCLQVGVPRGLALPRATYVLAQAIQRGQDLLASSFADDGNLLIQR